MDKTLTVLHQWSAPAHIKSRNKFGARARVYDGIRFGSGRELTRYGFLKLLQKQGMISGLIVHPVFALAVKGKRVCRYIADFQYLKDGSWVVEDVKGVRTRDYVIKRKLMKACLGIDVVEIR